MKIAYIIQSNEINANGVVKKVVAQCRYWRDFGNDVKIFVYGVEQTEGKWNELFRPSRVYSYRSMADRMYKIYILFKEVINWKPDLVYLRYVLYYPGLKSLAKKIPLVLEVNCNDSYEYRHGSKLRYIYNCITRGMAFHYAKGIIYVAGELASLKHFKKYKKTSCVISNGISLKDYDNSKYLGNEKPRLVYIGSKNEIWHGVDKVIKIAEFFPNWLFYLIGISKEAISDEVPNNIYFIGKLDKPKYDSIMKSSDVGIGTLALHRAGLNEASPLKVREYLAYGLPVINGYRDTDFPNSTEFILELPNIQDNITGCINEIENFVNKWRGRSFQREEVKHIDWEVKEKERMLFFNNILKF